jgi:hypothetical protein
MRPPLSLPPVSIERTLKFLFVAICIIFFASYTYFQARNLIHGPSIILSKEFETVQTERSIRIEGNARNVAALRLNGREIHTDERGNFSETLVLENGYTIMTLEAVDRYGRDTTLERTYIYEPETASQGEV